MGGAVSTGVDNDDLVDNLKAASYISTPLLERVFRAVDRGDYFTAENREQAYRDSAWKKGNLHLSAPCIYAKVMEGLQLAPGHSFLNLGSGTGYLSTMAGLIIGPYGVNHGVELHADVIVYATDRLTHFKSTSPAVDAFPFCEPSFVQGNCLCLPPDVRLYDRVYCGASCPESHEQYMKSLLKPGGILVMPLNDQLVKMTRKSMDSWETTPLLPVSFSSLVMPDPSHPPPIVILPNVELLDLQDLCRQQVRSILRESVETEHPELTTASNRPVQPRPKSRDRRAFRNVIVPYVPEPFYHESEDEDEDEEDLGLGERGFSRPAPRIFPSRAASQISAFLELARNLASQSRDEDEEDEDEEGENDISHWRRTEEEWGLDDDEEEEEEEEEHDGDATVDVDVIPEANLEKDDEDASGKGQRRSLEEDSKEDDGVNEKEGEEATTSTLSSNKKLKDKDIKEEKMEEGEVETTVVDSIPLPSSSSSMPHSDPIPVTFAISSPCSVKLQACKNNKKREKFDSGVGDEIENGKGPSNEGSEDDDGGMEVDSDRLTESDSDYSDNSAPRTKVTRYLDADDPNCLCGDNCAKAFIARRKKLGKDESKEMKEDENGEGVKGDGEDGEGEGRGDSTSSVEILSAIETYMREKINVLPLPQALKLYLNYNREL